MSKNIGWITTGDTTTLMCGGRTYTLHKTDLLFNDVMAALKEKRYDHVTLMVDKSSAVKTLSHGRFELRGQDVYYKGKIVHNYICDQVVRFLQQGFPFEPLLCFLERLLKNPDPRCIEAAYQFVSSEKLPISEDGLILGLKAVDHNYMDKFSHKIKNSIGKVVQMKGRPKIDDYGVACSDRGYHVGNLKYLNRFASGNDIQLVVSVDPADIISLPSDSFEGKMRVWRYRVVGRYGEEPLKAGLYSVKNRGKSTTRVVKSTLKRDKYGRFARKGRK